MKRYLLFLTVIFYFFSCSISEEDIIGTYVSRNNKNTVDTLRIKADGNYINLMYRKADNTLIYYNTGKWNKINGAVVFQDFYSDEDDIHSKEVVNYQEVLITTRLPIEKKSGKIIFHHKPMYENIYLEKLE